MTKLLLIIGFLLLNINTVQACSTSCEILALSLTETNSSTQLELNAVMTDGYDDLAKHSLNIMKGTEVLVKTLKEEDFDKAESIAQKIAQQRGEMKATIDFLESLPLSDEELNEIATEETQALFKLILEQTDFASKTIISNKLGAESLLCI